MSRGPQRFRQRDLTAAVKAMRAAGVEITRVEVEKNGNIILILATGRAGDAEQPANEWDDLLLTK